MIHDYFLVKIEEMTIVIENLHIKVNEYGFKPDHTFDLTISVFLFKKNLWTMILELRTIYNFKKFVNN